MLFHGRPPKPAPSAAASTVVYIAASGRSGSTLLERMLGTLPGFVNVGEVNDMFRRMARYDELCGCGLAFSTCDFWTQVGKRAFGGWSPELIDDALGLQRAVARQRNFARLLTPRLRNAEFAGHLERYADLHARLYAAVLAESGGRVVVDASKGAAQGLAVSRSPNVDMRLIHLVRDARGVAFSWAKSDVRRPHGEGPRSTMHSFRPADTAARWTSLQAEIAVFRTMVPSSVLVRYEDLVAEPAATLRRTVAALDLDVDTSTLTAVDGSSVDLPVSHGLSGNPSRFRSGRQELRLDEQWRSDMSRADRLATAAIAAGPLQRYGYLGGKRIRSAS